MKHETVLATEHKQSWYQNKITHTPHSTHESKWQYLKNHTWLHASRRRGKQAVSEMFSFLVFGMETCFDFRFSHLCFVSWTSNIIQDYRRQGTPFVMSSAIGPKCCRVTTYKYLASQWKPHVTLTHVIVRYNRRIVWQNMTWGSTTLNWLPA